MSSDDGKFCFVAGIGILAIIAAVIFQNTGAQAFDSRDHVESQNTTLERSNKLKDGEIRQLKEINAMLWNELTGSKGNELRLLTYWNQELSVEEVLPLCVALKRDSCDEQNFAPFRNAVIYRAATPLSCAFFTSEEGITMHPYAVAVAPTGCVNTALFTRGRTIQID